MGVNCRSYDSDYTRLRSNMDGRSIGRMHANLADRVEESLCDFRASGIRCAIRTNKAREDCQIVMKEA
eukprot:5100730-Amphidinium_carterae.1